MTIGQEGVVETFDKLKSLKDRLVASSLLEADAELSMGMSGDYA